MSDTVALHKQILICFTFHSRYTCPMDMSKCTDFSLFLVNVVGCCESHFLRNYKHEGYTYKVFLPAPLENRYEWMDEVETLKRSNDV